MSAGEEKKVIELKIDKLVNGGKGIGRYNNKVFFVKYAAPNEFVRLFGPRLSRKRGTTERRAFWRC